MHTLFDKINLVLLLNISRISHISHVYQCFKNSTFFTIIAMYDNVSQNIFRNALQNISPPPATCFAPRGAKSRLKIRPSLYVSSPQLVIGLKASPPRVIKLKVLTMHRTSGFRRAVLQSTSVLTQRSNIKRKPKRRITETRIEKKAQREANRIDQFHQRKRAGELTNGMALRNAALDS